MVDEENNNSTEENSSSQTSQIRAELEAKALGISDAISDLQQKFESQQQKRNEVNQMFSKMNILIGELRGKLMQQEKYIEKLESRALKSEELVNILDPMGLSKKFEEESMHIDAVEAKIDSFISLVDSVKSEISDVREKVLGLGSVNDLQDLNKNVQNLLKNVLQVESKLSLELERSQSFFTEMQKNYTQSLKYFNSLSMIDSSLKKLSTQQQMIGFQMKNYVPRELLNRRMEELTKFTEMIDKKSKLVLEQSGIRESSLSSDISIKDTIKNISVTEEVDTTIKKVEKPEIKKEEVSKKPVDDDLIFMRSY
ncbi:hypothetical protein JXM83_06210 [Candidatus Woesearchaeota archaeon]|nr:hypothetical protein [Candidatus Woesearchaeota archaeon]